MKPYIFMLVLGQEIEDSIFHLLLQHIREDKRKRLTGKRNAAVDLMLVGEMLAMYAIRKCFGIPMSEQRICSGEHGKPFLENDRNIHFNISHSGNRVVAAVCDSSVGIDIQQIRPYRFSTARRVCTPQELQSLEESENPEAEFTRLWAEKEAVVKMKGCGLAGLNRYSVKDYPYEAFRIEDYYLCVVWNG